MLPARSQILLDSYRALLKEYWKWFFLVTEQQKGRSELQSKPYRGPESWLKTDLVVAKKKYAEVSRMATALGFSKEEAQLQESDVRTEVICEMEKDKQGGTQ